jgi:hypothetical protein
VTPRLDFTNPETLHKLAALPFYGYAEALVRRIDPWWHAPEPPYTFMVHLGRDKTCSCCGQRCEEEKTVEVEAADTEAAEEIALAANKGWFVFGISNPKFPTVDVPAKFLEQFEKAP